MLSSTGTAWRVDRHGPGRTMRHPDLICSLAVVVTSLAACQGGRPEPQPSPSAVGDWFADQTEAAGLAFVHQTGAGGRYYIPEIMGSGVGLLDYDNDGDLDVFFAQGYALGRDEPPSAPSGAARPDGTRGTAISQGGRLFRNDLSVAADGTKALRLVDVTAESKLETTAYGMGVATGDIDNDGWTDLYLTNFGRNELWRNNGDGTFANISRPSGTDSDGWSVSASFLDYDRDGWLDLYVGNYLQYSIDADRPCSGPTGARDYCAPQVYRPQPDRLYRNAGQGRFSDVTTRALGDPSVGPALGVVSTDLDDDGWADIYVANDGQDNLLWMNQRDGTFRNTALAAGVAITMDGKAEASMGVDAGDFDNDGDDDLVMTELNGEGANLYANKGNATFTDRSALSGFGPATTPFTGFGIRWLDANNDGWLDALTVNGMVRRMDGRPDTAFPYDQRRQLLLNRRDGLFEDASARAGPAFGRSEVGRGAAFGDLDNDGDTDVVVSNGGGPARVVMNLVGSEQHWVGLRLVGGNVTAGSARGLTRPAGRDMLGARVTVVARDGSTRVRRAHADGSYASASDPRVLVGLASIGTPVTVRVRWPSGRSEEWARIDIDRYTTLVEGTGQ